MYGLLKKTKNIPFVEQEPISTVPVSCAGPEPGPVFFRV